MKKKIHSALAILLVATAMSAEPSDGVVIPLNPIKTQPTEGGGARMPIAHPVLYINGHVLTASSHTLGSTIQLLGEDGEVVFSTFVYIEGDMELPTTLSGPTPSRSSAVARLSREKSPFKLKKRPFHRFAIR
mgnify:CR=1 FL=1